MLKRDQTNRQTDRQRANGSSQGHASTESPELPGLAFSRPKKQIWPFLKLVGLESVDNLLSSWPYFRSIKVSIVKSKMLPFLKQRLAFVSYKHLATLVTTDRRARNRHAAVCMSRAGHFRYFLTFSIIKNDFFAFLKN